MRKLLAVSLVLALSIPALASPIEKGLFEVRCDGIYNIERTEEAPYFPVSGGLGVYATDGLLFGGTVSFVKRDWYSAFGVGNVWGLGAFGEYVLDTDTLLFPSLALSVQVLDSDNRIDSVIVGAISPGVRVAFSDMVSLAIQFHLNMADAPIYNFDREYVQGDIVYPDEIGGNGERVGRSVSVGLRVAY